MCRFKIAPDVEPNMATTIRMNDLGAELEDEKECNQQQYDTIVSFIAVRKQLEESLSQAVNLYKQWKAEAEEGYKKLNILKSDYGKEQFIAGRRRDIINKFKNEYMNTEIDTNIIFKTITKKLFSETRHASRTIQNWFRCTRAKRTLDFLKSEKYKEMAEGWEQAFYISVNERYLTTLNTIEGEIANLLKSWWSSSTAWNERHPQDKIGIQDVTELTGKQIGEVLSIYGQTKKHGGETVVNQRSRLIRIINFRESIVSQYSNNPDYQVCQQLESGWILEKVKILLQKRWESPRGWGVVTATGCWCWEHKLITRVSDTSSEALATRATELEDGGFVTHANLHV
jgi:hypothetical protein